MTAGLLSMLLNADLFATSGREQEGANGASVPATFVSFLFTLLKESSSNCSFIQVYDLQVGDLSARAYYFGMCICACAQAIAGKLKHIQNIQYITAVNNVY